MREVATWRCSAKNFKRMKDLIREENDVYDVNPIGSADDAHFPTNEDENKSPYRAHQRPMQTAVQPNEERYNNNAPYRANENKNKSSEAKRGNGRRRRPRNHPKESATAGGNSSESQEEKNEEDIPFANKRNTSIVGEDSDDSHTKQTKKREQRRRRKIRQEANKKQK